jgi:hypothetical protein
MCDTGTNSTRNSSDRSHSEYSSIYDPGGDLVYNNTSNHIVSKSVTDGSVCDIGHSSSGFDYDFDNNSSSGDDATRSDNSTSSVDGSTRGTDDNTCDNNIINVEVSTIGDDPARDISNSKQAIHRHCPTRRRHARQPART